MKQRRNRCVRLLAKSLLLLIAVSTALLLIWISTNPVDPTPDTHALLSSDEASGEPPPVSPFIPDTHILLASAEASGEPSPVAPAGPEDDDDAAVADSDSDFDSNVEPETEDPKKGLIYQMPLEAQVLQQICPNFNKSALVADSC